MVFRCICYLVILVLVELVFRLERKRFEKVWDCLGSSLALKIRNSIDNWRKQSPCSQPCTHNSQSTLSITYLLFLLKHVHFLK